MLTLDTRKEYWIRPPTNKERYTDMRKRPRPASISKKLEQDMDTPQPPAMAVDEAFTKSLPKIEVWTIPSPYHTPHYFLNRSLSSSDI